MVIRKNIVLDAVTLREPELDFVLQDDKTILPISLFTTKAQEPPVKSDADIDTSNQLSLLVNKLTIDKGQISFLDQTADNFSAKLFPVDLSVNNFSTAKNAMANFSIEAKSDKNERLQVQGEAGLAPLLVDAKIDVHDIDLTAYKSYLGKILKPEILSGKISLASHVHLISEDDKKTETTLEQTEVELVNFSLVDDGIDLVKLPRFVISDAEIDLSKQEIRIGHLNSQSAELHVTRGKDGEINLAAILKSHSPGKEPEMTSEEGQQVSPDGENPWHISLGEGIIEKYRIGFVDNGVNPSFTTQVNDFSLKLSDLSNTPNSMADLSFSFNLQDGGDLAGEGTIGITLLRAK